MIASFACWKTERLWQRRRDHGLPPQIERVALRKLMQLARSRELRDLRLKVTKQEWWKNQVEAATRNVARQEYNNSLMAELEKAINAQSAPLTKPSPNFATLYRQNQRSGWYYVEDSDE